MGHDKLLSYMIAVPFVGENSQGLLFLVTEVRQGGCFLVSSAVAIVGAVLMYFPFFIPVLRVEPAL